MKRFGETRTSEGDFIHGISRCRFCLKIFGVNSRSAATRYAMEQHLI